MKIAEDIDARGLLCPLPVLRARKRLMSLAPGACLRIVTDDAMALIDMPHFCAEAGHELLSSQDTDTGHAFVIRKTRD
ncbi:sulfurtransferase TusA family protein [Pseudooceanicola sediminis]|uniref:Sulfurtransferase TusA family protein n=1 Tax=Pseudooceanicola sediminis TaxID=2211117 RepID=A0A399J5V7_9RHOB|nr:sulfurtransferase TusA family protein [Pseudooceanicola sediminis]KAA2317477.1 sulfurtransferase TusA family protein [Puniceibacterium sp. HSS470]RII40795.1 sulfurtransferase TusA family protein [Pseudooceanicola sediminis]|tara:strand:- start:74304 stop:74537 length:234 start_codon:yes stop_codon:yes gene_type:complete